jgi:hypothetical protein
MMNDECRMQNEVNTERRVGPRPPPIVKSSLCISFCILHSAFCIFGRSARRAMMMLSGAVTCVHSAAGGLIASLI